MAYGDEYDPNQIGSDGSDQAAADPRTPATTDTRKRYNTTSSWQDPYNPPSPNDPYWKEWIAANPDYRGQGYNGPETGDKDGTTGGTGGGGGGTPPPPTNGGPQPTPSIYDAPLTKPYDKTFTPPPMINQGGPEGLSFLPADLSFTGANAPPGFPTIPKFQAPSAADALNDPGYQFRLNQGHDQLQNWAAAKGTLNDSSTAKSLEDYGQDAASQEYAGLWGRKMNEFQTNVQNQYLAPWAAAQQNWQAGVANPATLSYQTKAGAGENTNNTNYQNAWNQFTSNRNYYADWQNQVWNKLFQGATA